VRASDAPNGSDGPQIAFIILTKDEEPNLPACLNRLVGLPAGIFVIDCGSTDRTVEIARSFGARVLVHPWINYATQMNWAIQNIQTDAPWIMRLDADEILSPELRAAIRDRLPLLSETVSAAMVRLRTHFLGRWIRRGGMYPLWLLRIWRRGAAMCEERWMDEHMVLRSGQVVRLQADLIHDNRKSLDEWISKHIGYAAREARDLCAAATSRGLSGQAGRKRWFKENLYQRVPLFLRAWLYWFYRYFLRLGFLDGPEGFAYHFLQALWYRSLVDAKVLESRSTAARALHPASALADSSLVRRSR
jgi:glycosyltransferase involved in cell wall biosynthesis